MSKAKENRKGYKSTKLGLIPEEWETKTLAEIVDFLDGKRKPIKKFDRMKMKGKYPYYGASGIIDYVNEYIFNDELILLGEDGANIINRNSPLAFKVSGKIWVNNHAHVLKPKDNYSLDYITEVLESLNYDKYNSGTAQPKLNKEVCASIRIIIPPLPEQNKIAEILSTWDEAITRTEALIDKLKMRKKGLMQQLLTGKARLPGFTGELKKVQLGDITERITLKNIELNDNVVTISAQHGFVKQEEFFNKRVASKTLSGYYLLQEGEFAYNKSYSKGYPMGAFKRLDNFDKAVVTTLYICFKHKEGVNSDYLLNYFEAGLMIRNIMKIAQEGGRAHGLLNIGLSDFFSLELQIADLVEQKAIAKILNLADSEIKINEEYLQQLRNQKKGLIQKLLTGEVRVEIDGEAV